MSLFGITKLANDPMSYADLTNSMDGENKDFADKEDTLESTIEDKLMKPKRSQAAKLLQMLINKGQVAL